jgi:hypothetical protein
VNVEACKKNVSLVQCRSSSRVVKQKSSEEGLTRVTIAGRIQKRMSVQLTERAGLTESVESVADATEVAQT